MMDWCKLDESNDYGDTLNDSTCSEAKTREDHVTVPRLEKKRRLKTKNLRLNRTMSIYSFGKLVKSGYDLSKEPRKKSKAKFCIKSDGKQNIMSTAGMRQSTAFRGETRHFELLRRNSLPCGTHGCLDIVTDKPRLTLNEPVRSQAQPPRSAQRSRSSTTQRARKSKPSPTLYMVLNAQRHWGNSSSLRPMSAPSKAILVAKSKDSPPFRCGITRLGHPIDSIQNRKSSRTSVIRALKTPSTKFPIYPAWMPVKTDPPGNVYTRSKREGERKKR